MARSAIHTESFYPHPVDKVWRALTEPAAVAKWLMPNDFQPVVGHHFTFQTRPIPPHFDGIVQCEVIELDPPHTIAYTWRGGGIDTVVRWQLTAAEEDGHKGTRLLSVHSGFDLAESRNLNAFRGMAGGWGGGMIRNLTKALEEME